MCTYQRSQFIAEIRYVKYVVVGVCGTIATLDFPFLVHLQKKNEIHKNIFKKKQSERE